MPLITTNISLVLEELEDGMPVAIPTETVYGLAALINKPAAIKAVFEMKGRPLNHPLIVHIAKDFDISSLVEDIPEYSKQFMKKFWPGPLTLVFNAKANAINTLVTGGQNTVAIRCPAHELAQKVLQRVKVPIVAPSANPFGKVSPTTAQHVKQSFLDKRLVILDGGRCSLGIESTIIDATNPSQYEILRHGLIDEDALAQVVSRKQAPGENTIRVPGKLESHYQPEKNLYYFSSSKTLVQFCSKREGDVYVIASQHPSTVQPELFYPLAKTPEEVAFDLYYQLRQADSSQAICIAIELPPDLPKWQGVRERILKAGMPYSK